MARAMHGGCARQSNTHQKGISMADRQGTNVTATGTGKVQVAPDEAVVQLSIITEGTTAAEAVAANARYTQAVINAVSAQPNHGVTTSGLSVYPIVNYQQDQPPKIVGFRATNGVEVTTKPDYVGQIYDAGIAAGANQSSGITFRVQNEAPHREEALRLAMEQAFAEAKVVAIAANVELRGVETVQIEPPQERFFFRTEALDAKAAPTTPVIPESRTITARVHVQFRTRDTLEVRPGQGKPGDGRDVVPRPPVPRPPGRA
ncbi:MAG TPA: SIMPL domain-containing protein [Kofleriaceae bacterium]|nr:SIMPL domain-containing protein [Kofleriaceae bacterium]